ESNFRLEEGSVPTPRDGEVLIRVIWLSLDPYMRGRMDDSKSYAKPVALGEVMEGGGVGEVIASNDDRFAPGDIVMGGTGWTTHASLPGNALRKVDPSIAPIQTALGVLGMPGITAWTGLNTILEAKKGETIVVSAFDQNDEKVFFSSFGSKVDVAAPGGGTNVPPPDLDPYRNILSLSASGSRFEQLLADHVVSPGYLRLAGTSMATPHVTGLAALILARHPEFTNEDVRQVLRASADDVDTPGFDVNSGRGRINAARAVAVDSVLRVEISEPRSPVVAGSDLKNLHVKGTAAGPGLVGWQLSYGAGYSINSSTGNEPMT
ncbi:hypothetical protein LCGC14_1868510, partial [marine sediment metagenome]